MFLVCPFRPQIYTEHLPCVRQGDSWRGYCRPEKSPPLDASRLVEQWTFKWKDSTRGDHDGERKFRSTGWACKRATSPSFSNFVFLCRQGVAGRIPERKAWVSSQRAISALVRSLEGVKPGSFVGLHFRRSMALPCLLDVGICSVRAKPASHSELLSRIFLTLLSKLLFITGPGKPISAQFWETKLALSGPHGWKVLEDWGLSVLVQGIHLQHLAQCLL